MSDQMGSPKKASKKKCPICKQVTDEENQAYPFCSKRCRTIDLGRWATGDYVISRDVEQADLEEAQD